MFELQISVVPIWAKTTCMHGYSEILATLLSVPERSWETSSSTYTISTTWGLLVFPLNFKDHPTPCTSPSPLSTSPPTPPLSTSPPPLHLPSPSPPLHLPSPSPPLHLPSPSPSLHPYYPLRLRQPMNCTLYLRSVGFVLFQVEWERIGK